MTWASPHRQIVAVSMQGNCLHFDHERMPERIVHAAAVRGMDIEPTGASACAQYTGILWPQPSF